VPEAGHAPAPEISSRDRAVPLKDPELITDVAGVPLAIVSIPLLWLISPLIPRQRTAIPNSHTVITVIALNAPDNSVIEFLRIPTIVD
jgi:hypothetical protein